jgi:membrane protein YdbS with pleckstrin-like domain
MADERLEVQGGMPPPDAKVLVSKEGWDLLLIFFGIALSIEASVVGWWFAQPCWTTLAFIVLGTLTYWLFFYCGWFRDKFLAWINRHKATPQ